ncbi:MAG: Ankyrin repeat (3 copies) [Gammaproteobacteria bacterium]|jgi:ankyrin repeat protein|nr:Ankyrin repeat (3 copies) [Gammaproteobacteria bacterium]
MPIYLKDIFKTPKQLRFVEERGYDLNASIHEPHPEKGSFLIHEAAKYDKVETINALIKAGVDMNLSAVRPRKFYGHTPLIIALSERSTRTISYLIHEKADVEKCDAIGEFPLAKAARKGDNKSLKLLLDARANVDQENLLSTFVTSQGLPHKHMTALMYAFQYGMVSSVTLLLDEGANVVNSQNKDAFIYCDYEILRQEMKAKIQKRRSHIENQYNFLVEFSLLDSIVKLICGYTHGCNYNSSFFKFASKRHNSSLDHTVALNQENYPSKRRKIR